MIEREPQIDIEVEPDLEGRVVVRAHGALDLVEAAELRTILRQVCDGQGPSRVVLDLTDVSFVGSSGLGVIVEANNALEECGRSLVVRGAARPIRRAFQITHLDRIVAIEEDTVGLGAEGITPASGR